MEHLGELEYFTKDETREERLFKSLGNILKHYARGKATRDALLDNDFDLIGKIREIDQSTIVGDESLEVLDALNPALHADSFCRRFNIEDKLQEIKETLGL